MTKKMTVTIDNWDLESIEEKLFNFVEELVDKQIQNYTNKRIKTATTEAVEKIVSVAIQHRVEQEVGKILDEGWPRTDKFGVVRGSNATLRDRINEFFTQKGEYDKVSPFANTITNEVVRETKAKVNKIAKEHLEKFKKEMGEMLQAKVGEVLRKSIGL